MPFSRRKRRILLVQLPIPPAGTEPVRGNVPLAAGYLKLMARQRELEQAYEIDLFPARQANTLSDRGLVAAILEQEPWMLGFTCYLWNIDRTLWLAARLKELRPDLLILVGGPEITADNAWVLRHPAVDFAAMGEGEQTFCELLQALSADSTFSPGAEIAGLLDARRLRATEPTPASPGLPLVAAGPTAPRFRQPLSRLDEVSSPYLAGILDAAEEQMLLLETIRGCVFKCKFCYYPKSYDSLYFLSREKIVANLRHAAERGAREVVLLDPTLNQRRDFDDFLKLLAEHNPDRRFTYFGELRAEGITPATARLLREANFTEVEIGLQSVDPQAQSLMDRRNNLRAFERGVQAMLDVGMQVKVDLIIGLPGDTATSVRQGIRYLQESGLYTSVQVFNLAILPGTAFRQEADSLGLRYSPRTPYYVLETPTLCTAELYGLMQEAQEAFDVEFDPLPAPVAPSLPESGDLGEAGLVSGIRIDLDAVSGQLPALPAAERRAQAFTLWLQAADFRRCLPQATAAIRAVLDDNPHTTLQLLLEPTGDPRTLSASTLAGLRGECLRETSYLDRFYSIFPGQVKGAKRLIILAPAGNQEDADWLQAIEPHAELLSHSRPCGTP